MTASADDVASLRVPPHSIEAEHSVLGSLLLDGAALSRIADVLQPADFFRCEHKLIFEAVKALAHRGDPIDVITVYEQLEGDSAEYGDLPYLNQLAQSVPSATNIRRYAEIVADRAKLRRTIAAAHKIAASAFAAGADPAAVWAQAQSELSGLEAEGARVQRFSLEGIGATDEATERAWPWAGYVPPREITLFSGHGGAGKSTTALAMAAHVSVGRQFLGRETTRTPVAYFSAEDPGELLLARLRKIVRHFDLPADEVAQNVHVLDITGGDPTLYTESVERGRRVGTMTPTFEALCAYVERHGIGLVLIDNASDVFDGDEIRRASVRAFMRALAAHLARDCDCAVMLLSHVDKTTAKADGAGESYSGSTAWHNSARSRLFLMQKTPGELELRQEKCNLGPRQETIRLVWPPGGVPDIDRPLSPVVAGIEARNDTKAIVRLIHEFMVRGESISTATTSRTHAGKLLRGQQSFPHRMKDGELFDLLRHAERDGLLRRTKFKGTDRKERERWEVTHQGMTRAGLAATAATSSGGEVTAHGEVPAKEPAATAATSPPGVIGGKRAALGQPQPPQGAAR